MKNNYPTLEECYDVITKALQVLGVHYSPDHLPYYLLVPQIESLQRGYDRGIARINDLEHLKCPYCGCFQVEHSCPITCKKAEELGLLEKNGIYS